LNLSDSSDGQGCKEEQVEAVGSHHSQEFTPLIFQWLCDWGEADLSVSRWLV
jgi:hypothetical protein